MPIGAPLILTSRMQQNLLAAQLQPGAAQAAMFAAQAQPTLTAMHQGSLIQTTNANGEPNFVQVFGPLQTLDHMGGMLAGGAQLFEYPPQLDPSQAGNDPSLGFVLTKASCFFVFSISISHCGHNSSSSSGIELSRYQIEFVLFLVILSSADFTHLLLLPRKNLSSASTSADR